MQASRPVNPIGRSLPYWRLSGYYFFYFAFIGAFSPYFGLFLKNQGFSPWDIGVLLSQMQLMRLFGPTLWAWVSDRSGRRVAVIRLAALLSCLGLASGFLAHSFSAWFVVLGVMAFFWSAALPLVETLTLEHLAGRRGRYSRIRLWGSIGFIVAVLGTGWILDRVPIGGLLWVLLALLASVLAVSMGLHEASRAPITATEEVPWRQVMTDPRIVSLLGACFAMSAAHGALYVFYSIYLDEAGYNRTTVGALWSLGVVAEIGVFLVMARISERFGPERILLACLMTAVVRFLMIGWGVDSLLLLILAQLLHGVTFGAYHASAIAAVQAWFPARYQGRGQALYSSVSFGAGGLAGGLIAAALWSPVGGAWSFSISALIGLLGAVVFLRGHPALRRK